MSSQSSSSSVASTAEFNALLDTMIPYETFKANEAPWKAAQREATTLHSFHQMPEPHLESID